jgi:hypothetical protein
VTKEVHINCLQLDAHSFYYPFKHSFVKVGKDVQKKKVNGCQKLLLDGGDVRVDADDVLFENVGEQDHKTDENCGDDLE